VKRTDNRAKLEVCRSFWTGTGKPGAVTSKADCSFNAECIWEQGKASKGDGNVEVECAERLKVDRR